MINVREKYLGKNGKMGWVDRLYLPAIIKGMLVTLKHMLFSRSVTVQYPEEKKPVAMRYRGGRHILKRDEQGRERCTACYCCAYVCPAQCIRIVAAEVTDENRHNHPEDKYAEVFEINLFRCIFCGFCQEACPKGAIFMGTNYDLVTTARDKFVAGKDVLLEKQGGPIKIRV